MTSTTPMASLWNCPTCNIFVAAFAIYVLSLAAVSSAANAATSGQYIIYTGDTVPW